MIPPPISQIPPNTSLTFDHQVDNKLANQMQDMKLAPPLPQNMLTNSFRQPGIPNLQHSKSPNATNVTYSGTQKPMYPYMNNNIIPGTAAFNDNASPSLGQYSHASSSSHNKDQNLGSMLPHSQPDSNYSNGFETSQNAGIHSPGHAPYSQHCSPPHQSNVLQASVRSMQSPPSNPANIRFIANQNLPSPLPSQCNFPQQSPSFQQQPGLSQAPGFQQQTGLSSSMSIPSTQYTGMSPLAANLPHQPGSPTNYPYGMAAQSPIQQQPRKLDLDQMPSVVCEF